MDARRWQSDGHNEPHVQVVGFHVEGQSPSPSPSSILQDSLRTISSGSPTPVIIPPQFQRESSITRAGGESAATRSLAPEFSAGQNILRTTSNIDKKPAVTVPSGSLPPPAPPADAATATVADKSAEQQPAAQSIDATSSSSSAATCSSHPAGAGAATLQQQSAPSSSSSSQRESSAAAGAAAGADKAATSSSREGKKPQPPDGEKPPPKVPKPTSKAERRALQEAQRAAKAAQKGGAAPAGGKGAAGAAGGGADNAAAAAGAGRPPKAPSSQGAGAHGAPAIQGIGRAPSAGGYASDGSAGAAAGSRSTPGAGAAAGKAAGAASAAAGHKARGPLNSLNSTELFAHLQQYRPVSIEHVLRSKEGGSVHPAVLALGLRYADGAIKGSTARCVAMVNALCQVIADYHTPAGKSLTRDLMGTINASVDFLVRCRPLSVSMGNAIKALKLYCSKIDPAAPEAEAKQHLVTLMAEWLNEKVALADKVLVEHAVSKVYDNDVILTYAYSQVVLEVLLKAARDGKQFRVMVVDSRPELEGRQMMRRLLQADIPCSYVFLSGLSYSMREVTKVMLGAAAVLSNGTVLGRAGSAVVAMCAAASSKPVLVCCEAFKFHERVQLDSITHNELGNPDALAHLPPFAPAASVAPGAEVDPEKGVVSQSLGNWKDISRLALLNLKYDAMPAEYVTVVVTEFGMIPPSSVPVILREYSESAQLE